MPGDSDMVAYRAESVYARDRGRSDERRSQGLGRADKTINAESGK
jgi:hypothetical protein